MTRKLRRDVPLRARHDGPAEIADAGFTVIPNYFKRFWWPTLGAGPAALYELLLVYTHDHDAGCRPSMTTLAATLGIGRDTLRGRSDSKTGKRVPGHVELLVEHGLLRTNLYDDPPPDVITFWPARRAPFLTPEQADNLPAALPAAHKRLLDRLAERAGPDGHPSLNDKLGDGHPSPVPNGHDGHTPPPDGHTPRGDGHPSQTIPREQDPTTKEIPTDADLMRWRMLEPALLSALSPSLQATIYSAVPLRTKPPHLFVRVTSTTLAKRWMMRAPELKAELPEYTQIVAVGPGVSPPAVKESHRA